MHSAVVLLPTTPIVRIEYDHQNGTEPAVPREEGEDEYSCESGMLAMFEAERRPESNDPIRPREGVHHRHADQLCATLVRYLRAPKQVLLEWPLAEGPRGHIHRIIESSDVSVHHTTRRTGRPFTLVLEKTRAVFEHDTAERRRWQEEFAWLTKTARSC